MHEADVVDVAMGHDEMGDVFGFYSDGCELGIGEVVRGELHKASKLVQSVLTRRSFGVNAIPRRKSGVDEDLVALTRLDKVARNTPEYPDYR